MSLSLRLSGGARRRHCPHGKFPSVSINNNKTVVEFYQPAIVSSQIFCKVGKLEEKTHEMDMCEEEIPVCVGRYPKVAINDNNIFVEVHEGIIRRHIYYRLGHITDVQRRVIKWNTTKPEPHCWGCLPAVAVYDNTVVVTYDYPYFACITRYSLGKINMANKRIDWTEEKKRLFASNYAGQTSVAINRDFVVAVCRGFLNEILCQVGRIQENGQNIIIPNWQELNFQHTPYGYSPNICLQNDEHVLVVWQSTTLRRLMYTTGIIEDHNDNLVLDDVTGEPVQYDYGYNPSATISSRDGFVIVEHETNFSGLSRCRLYYNAGKLIKDDEQNAHNIIELPQANGHPLHDQPMGQRDFQLQDRDNGVRQGDEGQHGVDENHL